MVPSKWHWATGQEKSDFNLKLLPEIRNWSWESMSLKSFHISYKCKADIPKNQGHRVILWVNELQIQLNAQHCQIFNIKVKILDFFLSYSLIIVITISWRTQRISEMLCKRTALLEEVMTLFSLLFPWKHKFVFKIICKAKSRIKVPSRKK